MNILIKVFKMAQRVLHRKLSMLHAFSYIGVLFQSINFFKY